MKQAYDGMVYDTDKATILARSEPSINLPTIDLYRTEHGRYFSFTQEYSLFNHEPTIKPLATDEAVALYNTMTKRALDFSDAFPDLQFTDA